MSSASGVAFQGSSEEEEDGEGPSSREDPVDLEAAVAVAAVIERDREQGNEEEDGGDGDTASRHSEQELLADTNEDEAGEESDTDAAEDGEMDDCVPGRPVCVSAVDMDSDVEEDEAGLSLDAQTPSIRNTEKA